MKAASYTQTGPASEVLKIADLPDPTPGPGEVLVRVMASGVNPSDVKARAGLRAGGSGMPYPRIIPHSDGAGEIIGVGEGVDASRMGERVWIWNGQWQRAFGTAAELITVPAEQAVPLPNGVSFDVGAGLGIPALTAAHAVFSNGDVTGQKVLISGGAGVVGRLAIQFARYGGADVYATARGENGLSRIKQAGVHHAFDFSAPDVEQQLAQEVGDGGFDRIIEVEFGLNADLDANLIRPRGRIVTFGSALNLRPEIPFYTYLFKGITIEFVLTYLFEGQERRNAEARVHDALEAGALDIPIAQTFSLEDCAAAHEAVEAGGRDGVVVVRP